MKTILIVFISMMFLVACGGAETNNSSETQTSSQVATTPYKNISVNDLHHLMHGGNFVLLDVRTPEEVAKSKINGSYNLDFNSSDFKEKLNTIDKNKKVVVYCRSGGRSAKACKMMEEMGFKDANNVEGGILAWEKLGISHSH